MAEESRVRTLLEHTWHPFYGKFGRLRPIQRLATEPICRGKDVLVGAPTASGKTEAVLAPMIERLLQVDDAPPPEGDGDDHGLRLMVVTPTRALTRDLRRRLRGPVEACGLTVGIKTGDTSSPDPMNLPDILCTTPESLDSLLARHPSIFRELSGLMLDEVHLLDGSARGDQLQALLSRCRQIRGDGTLQVCGASATLADGERLARRYLSDEAMFLEPSSASDDTDVVDGQAAEPEEPSEQQRPLEAELLPAAKLEHATRIIADIFRGGEARKLLVFANARAQVEDLTAHLREEPLLRDRVVSHHGSLSRSERLRAEDELRDAPAAICVATMTLEVGIDIGDVDRAILVGVPPDVSSLLQRIGRSNRRDEVTRVTCLYQGEFEKLRMTHLLECASRGSLFAEDIPFRPTVIPQQALSLLYQNPKRWVDAGALHARLPERATTLWDRVDCREILQRMADDGILRSMRRERFTTTHSTDKMFKYGQIHSNIEDQQEVEVIDEMTRRVVGTVRFFESHQQELLEGGALAVSLGGEGREVVRMDDDQLVTRRNDDLGNDPQFIASRPPRYSRELARDFAKFLDVPALTMVLDASDNQLALYHFLGTVWGRLFEGMLGNVVEGARNSHRAFYVKVGRPPDPESAMGSGEVGRYVDPEELRSQAESVLQRKRRTFMRLLGAGPHLSWLPPDLLDRWLRRAIDVEHFVEVVSKMTIERQRISDGAE